jgi:hypothetical protein
MSCRKFKNHAKIVQANRAKKKNDWNSNPLRRNIFQYPIALEEL